MAIKLAARAGGTTILGWYRGGEREPDKCPGKVQAVTLCRDQSLWAAGTANSQMRGCHEPDSQMRGCHGTVMWMCLEQRVLTEYGLFKIDKL